MASDIEQLSGLPKSSEVVNNVESIAWRREAGIAQWLASLRKRPYGLMDLALGWYRDMSRRRSLVKSVVLWRRKCASCNNLYPSGELAWGI
jgi:hypothetical protein